MPRQLAWSLACLLALSTGCPSKSNTQGAEEAGDRPTGELSGDGPSAPAPDDRIPLPKGAALGPQAGHLAGAFAYGTFEFGALHQFFAGLPLDARSYEELGELGRQLGLDLRSPQMLASLGIDEHAKISVSARLLDNGHDELRAAWTQSSPLLDELHSYAQAREEHGAIPTEIIEQPAEEPVEAGDPEQPIAPVPAPPAPSPAALQLQLQAQNMGFHLRAHFPVRDMALARPLIQRLLANEPARPRWAETCAALGPTLACLGRGDGVLVLRELPGALQIDMLVTFVADHDIPDSPERGAIMRSALAAPASTPAHVAALRGTVGASFDGPGIVALMRAELLARSVAYHASGYADADSRQFALDEAITRMHETERMFEGITIEGELAADAVNLRGRWLATAQGRGRAGEVFALTEIDADVPTIASLCSGALICGRSRGVPRRERFAALAKGLYADPRGLERILNRFEEEATAIALLETWPNLIGSSSLLPGTLVGPAESLAINNGLGVLSRVLGFGFSVRSLQGNGRTLNGDYVGYARLSAADLAALVGMLRLAELNPMPTSLEGIGAQVSFAPLPSHDFQGNFYALSEPDAGAGAWGWAVIADGDDRVRWLADRAHDDGSTPLIYGEFGDLWRLVASFEEGRRELGFAQSWLNQRWVRAQVDLDDEGLPQLRFAMGKR